MPSSASKGTSHQPLPATTQYHNLGAEWCDTQSTSETITAACASGITAAETATCARTTLLFVRTRTLDDDGTPGPWTDYTPADKQPACVTTARLTTALTTDVVRRTLTPSTLSIQPAATQVLLNVPVIVSTTADPQTITTTVLGIRVDIQATPTTYTWTYGDDTTQTTKTPGRPWPATDIQHTYTHPGDASITLTTTWTARFRVTGQTTWYPVTGTATTTSPTHPITVVAKTTHLVEDPVAGS